MEALRLQAVAARVVAWHNRHPLARRISAAQVHSIGYVALPFAWPAGMAAQASAAAPDAPPEASGGSLRERALARARQAQGGATAGTAAGMAPPSAAMAALPAAPVAELPAGTRLAPAFSAEFLAPLSPRRVARWAARHGRRLAGVPGDGPVRQAASRAAAQPPLTLYVLTAAIDVGLQRSRVLLGAGEHAAVLGGRLWDRGRLAVLVLATVAAPALVLGLALGRGERGTVVAGVSAAAVAAASAASAASGGGGGDRPAPVAIAAAAASARGFPAVGEPARAHPPVAAAEPGHAPAGASAPASVAATPAAAAPVSPGPPPGVEPRQGRIDMPSLRPSFGKHPPAPAGPPVEAAVTAVPAARAVAASPAPPNGTPALGAFAVSTRLLRTRAEAEQVMAAMAALLQAVRGPGVAPVTVEILAEGADWRVVGWPYAARPDADRARALLVARGMRVEVLAF